MPTTQGIPSSRETIAAWQVIPPESVTIAAALRISGTQSGAVMWVTRTSPSTSSAASSREPITRTVPLAIPGAAPSPLTSSLPASAVGPGSPSPPVLVTGLDCSIQILPASSIAHSVSCGAP